MAPTQRLTKSKYAKAYKAMKSLGYTAHIVKPVLKNLLKLYDENWSLIEDGHYAVLVDAILDSEECKKGSQKFRLQDEPEEDEPEEDEPPLKRLKSRDPTVQTSSPLGISRPSSNRNAHMVQHVEEEMMTDSSDQCVADGNAVAKILTLDDCQIEQKRSSPCSFSELKYQRKKIKLLSDEESSENEPLSPYKQLDDNLYTDKSRSVVLRMRSEKSGHSSVVCPKNIMEFLPDDDSELELPLSIVPPDDTQLLIEGDGSSAKENLSTSPEVIDLDADDISALQDGASSAKESLQDGASLASKEEDCSCSASHLDIASSCRGEVKLSVNFGSSLPPSFRIPSLDAVLRLMEQKYLKSYGITEPEFSILKLMNDICESFLEAGTIFTADEGVIGADVHSAPVASELDVQDVANQNLNLEVGFCVAPYTSMGNIKLQSLIEIRPHIPRFRSMNFTQCKIELPLVVSNNSYWKENRKAIGNLKSSTARSMVIFQKQHSPPNLLSTGYFVDDITRGEEDFPISLINEVNSEQRPMFNYIPRNISYQNAYVKFLLARISDDACCSSCSGDCLIPELPCACAGETGGEFAYLPEGLVKEKFLEDCISMNRSPQQKDIFYCRECPLERSKNKRLSGKCKGHLVKKFIKECWYKCGCSKDCGNRVVQSGITRKLQVFMTPEGKGWGLRTLEDLPKGAFVCEYVGEIVTNMELFDRNKQTIGKKHTYPVLLDADWSTEGVLNDEEALCLDATFYGNAARFINHRCHDANLVEIPVEVETPDHHYYHLAFFTTRKVFAFKELTWDYGIDFGDYTHPVEAFPCRCGSQFCRDSKTVNRRL